MSDRSYRTILRSSSIVGGAQIVGIACSLAKMKVAAVLLGPAGVGLVGLYMSLIQTAASIAALGSSTVGTRQIAASIAVGGVEAVSRTRQALFWGTLALASMGGSLFWLLSGWIARAVIADETRSTDVAWLSIGVALSVAGGSQGALLTGLRRVGDLACINVGAAVLGALFGTLALFAWGVHGLMAMVLIGPVASFLLGHIYVARLPRYTGSSAPLREMTAEWRIMLQLGFAFMLSGLVSTLGHLAVRALVQRELGLEAVGHFQAAWAIGMTYLSFVLGAMGTDYYPRLTAAINDAPTAARLVNEQTEVALLLCAPVLLAMLGLAPWVISLLYSADFAPAVETLRWQLMGDILKIVSWPLGFVMLAAGAGKAFVMAESISMAVFVVGVFLGLPLIGVTATGCAFIALYSLLLVFNLRVVRRLIAFQWTRSVKLQTLAVLSAAVVVFLGSRRSDLMGVGLGLALAALTGIWALIRISAMIGVAGRLGRVARLGASIEWMTARQDKEKRK